MPLGGLVAGMVVYGYLWLASLFLAPLVLLIFSSDMAGRRMQGIGYYVFVVLCLLIISYMVAPVFLKMSSMGEKGIQNPSILHFGGIVFLSSPWVAAWFVRQGLRTQNGTDSKGNDGEE